MSYEPILTLYRDENEEVATFEPGATYDDVLAAMGEDPDPTAFYVSIEDVPTTYTWAEGVGVTEREVDFLLAAVNKMGGMDDNELEAFLAWVCEEGLTEPEELGDFHNFYRGVFDDLEEFARDAAATMGDPLPEWAENYVDWEELGESFLIDYTKINLPDGRIALFRN